MVDQTDRLAGLSPEKRALLARRMHERQQAEDVFPLSVMQQRLWFLTQLSPDNLAYVIPAAVRISGELDCATLQAVVDEIVRRHESLRTTFARRDGQPVQIVSPYSQVKLPIADLRPLAALDRDELIAARLAELVAEPFDLATGPLLRLWLLRTDDREHVLLVAMHHIIADGWSLGVLVSELAQLYPELAAGRPPSLPELKIQYADFAFWQRQWLAKADLTEELDYWRQQLAGAPPMLTLATDRARPAVQTFRGGSVQFALPAGVRRQLTELAQGHGATTFMALLTVWYLLLQRYSGQDDLVVGVPVANRSRPETEGLIGFFVNTLAIRADLTGQPSFVELLRRVRDNCLGAYAHQELPFEKLVEELKPTRDLSRPPFFQVSFSYQSAPLPGLEVAGLRFDKLPLPSTTARFELELQFFADDGEVTGWFEYNRDLFDESTVTMLADHFRRLVELVVANPDQPAVTLPLLSPAERHDLLVGRTATAREWSDQGLIHQCFEQQAKRTPHAEAVRFQGQSLSYQELNRRANQLAHRLRTLGVGPDVLVGVGLERSLELMVSLLAVLKAGGAYVPLDPTTPMARLEFMLADSGVPILLTQRAVRDRMPTAGAEVLCVDQLAGELAAGPDHDPQVELVGDELAYVIYTSGSTGTPKGVMNVHSAIRNRLLWMQDAYRLDATDRVLQKTPCSFDVSVWEFFWPLMTGACLVVARPEGHKDGRYLVETIRQEEITTLHFVPSMLTVFLQEPDVEQCRSLRRVICSGEALSRELQQRFFTRLPAQLHNLYGPTEAAVDVTAWACRRDDDPRPVPIGFPIANTQLYVLDRFGQLAPAGVPGELCIGGRNLARGYLNRPELTAEKFIPHPWSEQPEERLYRTGDLVRYRADGALEYLGRLDHQVKLRGFRIELGEIEQVLLGQAQVDEVVVTTRRHPAGDDRLVAYLTGAGEPAAGDLIAFLQPRLPDYMIPATFVCLPSMPLTHNGKIDRAALPEPRWGRPELRTTYEAPATELEHTLAEVWGKLLGVERPGVHDNFFELGGHSLLMAELRDTLQQVLDCQLSIVELFQYPTVRSLAEHLTGTGDARNDPLLRARERVESRRQSLRQRQAVTARRPRAQRTGRMT